MDNQQTTLTIREYPFGTWIAGAILVVSGLYFSLSTPGRTLMGILTLSIGVVFFLVSTVLTVTADRLSQTITLNYRAPFWCTRKEIPLREVTGIQLDASQDSDGTTYRIVILRENGQIQPFHSYYSSGKGGKQKKVDRLRAFLGVRGKDEISAGPLQPGQQMIREKSKEQQDRLSGSAEEEHLTNGVHWRLQTISLGGQCMTRWFSADYKYPNGFIFLSQKATGQKTMAGGLIGGVGKLIYQQAVKLYGFCSEDTPGLETADLLAPLDRSLENSFTALTSDPAGAQQFFNPWVTAPLADWAARYPLKNAMQAGIFGQLVILFSPCGVYIASMASQQMPEAVEEMTTLGVALVSELK